MRSSGISVLGKIARIIKNIPGAVWILDPVRRHFSFAGEQEVADFAGDLKIHLRLNEHMESKIFWFGSYSRDILITLRRILKPGMTVFDVGANIGEVSLFSAKLVGGSGKVVSFEPMPDLAIRLERHKTLNGFEHIEIIRCGLGNERGTLPVYSAKAYSGDGLAHSGMTTMFKTEERDIPVGSVPVKRLDTFVEDKGIDRVDLIKIDIEGAELTMLYGAEVTLKRDKPDIIIEINEGTSRAAGYESKDILQYLSSFGYSFQKIGRKGRLSPIDKDTLREFQNVLCRVQPGS